MKTLRRIAGLGLKYKVPNKEIRKETNNKIRRKKKNK